MFHDHNEINSEISDRQNWKIPKYLEIEQLPNNPSINEERSKNQWSKLPPQEATKRRAN